MHETILQYWPELAPIIALHLSDDTGEPMHSEANGWYWLQGYYGGMTLRGWPFGPEDATEYHGGTGKDGKDRETCLRIFAEHARIDTGRARILAEEWRAVIQSRLMAGTLEPGETVRGIWREWLRFQGERYKAETAAAIALLDTLAGGAK